MNPEFEKELTHLINRYSIENEMDMPDFLLAKMLCKMIESMGPTIKKTLDWHGCNSVCHPQFQPWLGSNKLFDYRELNGGWQVCDGALQHICICDTENMAQTICDSLNNSKLHNTTACSAN